MNIGTRQPQETLYKDFVKLVKDKGIVRAEMSHTQTYPTLIYNSAILDWQYDIEKDVLFSISKTGKRVECTKHMPAFHVYEGAEYA